MRRVALQVCIDVPHERATYFKRIWTFTELVQRADRPRQWVIVPRCLLVITDHVATACCSKSKEILMDYRRVNEADVYLKGAVQTIWTNKHMINGRAVQELMFDDR
jgi:hypothetical protein